MTRWYQRRITHTELLARLKVVLAKDPPKVVRFQVVKQVQERLRKEA